MELLKRVEDLIKAEKFLELDKLNLAELAKLGKVAPIATPQHFVEDQLAASFLPKRDTRLRPSGNERVAAARYYTSCQMYFTILL